VKNTFLFCEQKQKDIRQDQQDCVGFASIKLMNPVNPVGPISFFLLLPPGFPAANAVRRF
jgi:hypothetical protein